MTKIDNIQESWEEYRKKTIPPMAPRIQVQEMQKAFYMGALMMLENTALMSSQENISEEEASRYLEEQEQFLINFFKTL